MNTLQPFFDTRNFSDQLTQRKGSGFTLFKRGQCPICRGTSKGCRESNTTGLIFCRDSGANPTAYLYRGEDVHGFGLWQSTADADAFTSQSTESRERQRREFLESQQQQLREQIARQMPEVERNRWYQQLLDQLVLTDADLEKLLARGFTREQIITDGYKSITAWQKIGKRFPLNLPGILTNGVLNLSGDGILCPIRNLDGLIIGCQVRLHDGTQGRYRWLTSATKKNPKGATSHLNGELPVGVFEPNDFLGSSIWVTEGTSIKPSLARYRLGVPVVGAASGRFDSSRETVKASIEYLAIKYRTNILTFAIDAGDVVNRSGVPERWQQQFEFFSSLGYHCRVAWWGQVTKEHDDIDELKDDSQIQFITLNQFLSICEEHKLEKPKTENSKPINPDEWKEAYELRRKDRASFKFTRTAQIVVKDGFLPSIKLEAIQPGIIGIRGDWGIGKSFLISSWCKEWKHKIIQVAHLNALLSNTAPKFDCFHHRELKDMQLGVTSASRLSITDISLAAMFDPDKWAKGEAFILILDEIEQALHSIQTNSNLKGKLRLKARIKLEWLIKNATYIIASDRDLCDETLNYIEQVRGDNNQAFLIHHTGKKGISRQAIVLNFNKRKDEVLTQLINDAKLGKKIIIPCENKSDLLAIELQLLEAGISDKSMFFAHGDNSNEPGTKELIEKADEIYTDYQIIGYTMTMGTALSFEKQHFGKCYAFFSGDVLSANSQAQMLFRYRPECNIIVWINPRRKTLEIEPNILLKNLVKKVQETDALIASIDQLDELIEQGILLNAKAEISQEDLPWIHHKLSIIARANASKANPFQSLHDLLIEAGFTLKFECNDHKEPLTTDEGNIHKEQKKEIKSAEDKAIADAELMSDPEFQSAMMNSGNLKKSERERLKKTQLHRDTGLEITQPIVKLQRTKKLTQGVKTLKVLLGDEATSVAYDLTDRERNPDVYDQKFYAARRRLLCELGVPEILNKLRQGWSYTNDTSEVVVLADKARTPKLRVDIKRLLEFTVSLKKNKKGSFKVSNSAILGSILNALSVERESTKTRTEGNIYKLNLQHWEMLQGILVHMDRQAHTPTLAGVIDKAQAAVNQDSVLRPQSLAEGKIALRNETLQTQSQSVFEGVPHPTDISYIYKNSEAMEQKPENCIKGESPVEKLLKISNWGELNLTQSEVDKAWPLLTQDEQSHLWQLHQEYQQIPSLEQLAQQAIAKQVEIKEVGFGSHFRSYVIKAVCGGVAIARECWGLKRECEIPLSQLSLSSE